MARYYKSPSEGSYAGHREAKHMQEEDGDMISENRSEIANLPQEVMIKAYPKADNYLNYDTPDTLSKKVDAQIREDGSKRDSNFVPKRF